MNSQIKSSDANGKIELNTEAYQQNVQAATGDNKITTLVYEDGIITKIY